MRAVPLLAAAALAGCSMAPKYVRGDLPVPPSWPVGDSYLRQSEAALPAVPYAEIFTDLRLQALIQQSLANNRDLRVAAANLAAARAQVRIRRAAQLPQLDAGAAVTRSNGTDDRLASTNIDLTAGISAFELDLFGRLASATEAQRQIALATEAAARTVRLGLIADIANTWAARAADADLLRIAQDTAANARRTVALTRARLSGGVAPRTDLRQAEQVLATAEGDVAEQTALMAQDENLLRLLVGASIDPALLPGGLAEVIPTVAVLPAGTSSEVLLRRPDVLQAEYELRAANADVGVARAQLFPRISLTGLLGFASDALSSIFAGGAFRSSVGADAGYAIFAGGGARANVAASQARRGAALAGYEQAIQTAFREVADALAAQGTIADRLRASETLTAAAADTARLTVARYRGGVASSLENLDAQRSLYAAERAQVAVRLAAIVNRVALYRALASDAAAAGPADHVQMR
ncbi:MAG: efflux transporter outer membrane subunit [Pseudomonadota bacterium]